MAQTEKIYIYLGAAVTRPKNELTSAAPEISKKLVKIEKKIVS